MVETNKKVYNFDFDVNLLFYFLITFVKLYIYIIIFYNFWSPWYSFSMFDLVFVRPDMTLCVGSRLKYSLKKKKKKKKKTLALAAD